MSTPRDTDDARLRDLIDLYIEGGLSDPDRAALDARLRDDASARRLMLERLDLHAALMWRSRGAAGQPARTHRAPMPRRRDALRIGLAAGFAAAMLIGLGAVVLTTMKPVDGTGAPDVAAVAEPMGTVVASRGALTFGEALGASGQDVVAGPVSVEDGLVELHLRSGAEVRIIGDARLRLIDPKSVRLEHGFVEFDCPPAAHGFTVALPGGARVVDLGTAFSVHVLETGDAAVRVTDGAVRFESDAGEPVVLHAGSSARLAKAADGTLRLSVRSDDEPTALSGVTATASSELVGVNGFNRAAAYLVDRSGLDEQTGAHAVLPDGAMWLSLGRWGGPRGLADDLAPAVTLDLGRPAVIGRLRVWNYNEAVNGLHGRGVSEMRVLVSAMATGDDFAPVTDADDGDTVFRLERGPGRGDVGFSQTLNVARLHPVRRVRLQVLATHNGNRFDAGPDAAVVDDAFVGLSEVQLIGRPVGERPPVDAAP